MLMVPDLSFSWLTFLIRFPIDVFSKYLIFFYCFTDVAIIVKIAQLEFKYGEAERGKTMFENIVSNFPKRTDLWSIYIDMTIQQGDKDAVR